ncbi:CorA Mg2+ and Co2+ transporters [Rhabdaerophilaceae bacterium]
MIVAYLPTHIAPDARAKFLPHAIAVGEAISATAVWIDVLNPTPAEEAQVEQLLAIDIPTREETKNLEPSEVLYVENGARYMSAQILCQSESDTPKLAAVSFILKDHHLVTVRYDQPRSFQMFANRVARPGACLPDGENMLISLFETVVDRAAELLRASGERIDVASLEVFAGDDQGGANTQLFRRILRTMGLEGIRISKVRESLVSIERMLLFLTANTGGTTLPESLREEVRTTLRDFQSLEDHATFLSAKIQFLIDATLGLVSLEQNKIIKIFSVAAVIFLPPTLIASIYGMNFKAMPELEWSFGYPMAIGLMLLSVTATYSFFKMKRWL